MIRAFFALPLSEPTEQQLAEYSRSLKTQLSRQPLRWLPPQNLHITLAFLGNVRESDIERLAGLAEQVVSRHSSAELVFNKLGWLPSPHKPKVLVLEPEASSALQKLQSDLTRELRAKGYSVENRRYRPHISLARVKGQLSAGGLQSEQTVITSSMDELVLFESQLTPQGAKYHPLFAVPLY